MITMILIRIVLIVVIVELHSWVNLPLLENLVITCPYTARSVDRLSAPQAHQCKITQSTGMSTQMQLKKIAWLPGLLKREKTNKVLSFFDVIFDVYTHVDNRDRARETISLEKKTWKFHSGGEKMRNASSQVKMSGSEKIIANMDTENKIFGTYAHMTIPP